MKKKVIFIVLILVIVLFIIRENKVAKIRELCDLIDKGNNTEAIELASKIKNLNTPTEQFVRLTEAAEGIVTTPLTKACETGNSEMIIYLLEHGADTEYAPGYIIYPLESFCDTGTGAGEDALNALLNHGADPNKYKRISPVFRVAGTLEHRAESTYETGVRMVLILLENGAYWQNPIDGNTILHYAAFQKNATLMKELLKLDESKKWLNVKNDKGETPLDFTMENNNIEAMQLLKDAGAK